MQVTFVSEMKEDCLLISVKGRLDTLHATNFIDSIEPLMKTANSMVLDMAELEYISSAGLRIILALKKNLDKDGKELEIHNINAVVKEVFEVTGFINILNIK